MSDQGRNLPNHDGRLPSGGRPDAALPVGAEGGAKAAGERKRNVWRIVFVIALVVFAASLIALGVIAFSYLQGQQKYADIAATADFDPPKGDDDDIGNLTVDWDALLAANPDTVAWVYIPGTAVNYPVVQGEDDQYYLNRDFDGEAGWLAEYGAIFLHHGNNPDWSDAASFVFGHHMNDGSMFADISAMQDQGRFDASRIVYLLTPKGNFKLRSFTLVHCDAGEPLVVTKFKDAAERTSYVKDKIDRAAVDVGTIPKASEIDKLFAFSTCDNYGSGRYILYTYVLDTSVADLAGKVGVKKKKGEAEGLVGEFE